MSSLGNDGRPQFGCLGQLRKAGLVISDRRSKNFFHGVAPGALQALRVTFVPVCCRSMIALSCSPGRSTMPVQCAGRARH